MVIQFIQTLGPWILDFLPASHPMDQELVESKQPLEGMEITFEAYTNEDGSAAGHRPVDMKPKKQRNGRFR